MHGYISERLVSLVLQMLVASPFFLRAVFSQPVINFKRRVGRLVGQLDAKVTVFDLIEHLAALLVREVVVVVLALLLEKQPLN